jgi:hypothetical protein
MMSTGVRTPARCAARDSAWWLTKEHRQCSHETRATLDERHMARNSMRASFTNSLCHALLSAHGTILRHRDSAPDRRQDLRASPRQVTQHFGDDTTGMAIGQRTDKLERYTHA